MDMLGSFDWALKVSPINSGFDGELISQMHSRFSLVSSYCSFLSLLWRKKFTSWEKPVQCDHDRGRQTANISPGSVNGLLSFPVS
jgi:hypothetical protein